MPGTVAATRSISAALRRSTARSAPKILMAICALTPDTRWSMRCEIGWPILITMPGIWSKRARMSLSTALFERFETPSSTSISLACTPSAWSSSSARPVRLPVRWISGTCNNRVSASAPRRFDASKDVPGGSNRLIVTDPSLNGGKNSLPKVEATTRAKTNSPNVAPSATHRY